MSDLTDILARAETHGLRLNSFWQLDSGAYRANWRNAETKMFYGAEENADPFRALSKSFEYALQGKEFASVNIVVAAAPTQLGLFD